jgi:hypothetical protein
MVSDTPTIDGDLLPACTVRVEVGGQHAGTGFFAAPGVVVTCAHVIGSLAMTSNEAETDIQIATGPVLRPAWPILVSAEADLALLRLTNVDKDPCVLVDVSLRPRDPLHTFGYPGKHKEGVPTTLESEGLTGGLRQKLKGGQVAPGMSGSPVLNLRTGGVCGVLKSTRDDRQDLGGYAIPIAALLRLDSTLRPANERYHESNPTWRAQLSLEQRRLLRTTSLSVSPTGRATTRFAVTVGPSDKSGWAVTADVFPSNLPTTGPVPVDLNTVRLEVARLFRDWASRGRVDEGEQIRLLGSILSRAVFPDEVGDRLRQLLSGRDKQRVLVTLRFEDAIEPDLVHLPWEHLYVPREGSATEVYFARDSDLGFARALDPPDDAEPGQVERRALSVLLVGVKPPSFDDDDRVERYPAQNVERAVTGMRELAQDLAGLEVVDVDTPNPEELVEAVASVDCDVVHYIGFGRFDQGHDELLLGAHTREGVEHVDGDMFAECLHEATPRLVILQLCEAAAGNVPADFALLAPAVLGRRVPAVVAYQYPLPPDPANRFNHALYTILAGGGTVDAAVQIARNKLWLALQRSRAFVSPALFLGRPSEIRLTAGTREVPAERTASAFAARG